MDACLQCRTNKAQGVYANAPEPSLLAHTKYGSRLRHRPIFMSLAMLVTPPCAILEAFCVCVISIKSHLMADLYSVIPLQGSLKYVSALCIHVIKMSTNKKPLKYIDPCYKKVPLFRLINMVASSKQF